MADLTRHMRFRMSGPHPVPVHPDELPEPDVQLFTAAAVIRRRPEWTRAKLAELWDRMIPPPESVEQRRWQDAIADPDLWPRLAGHADRIGRLPPAAFLLALLLMWENGERYEYEHHLLAALGVQPFACGEPDAGGTDVVRDRPGGR